jgi:predicted phosphodiesterase
MKANKYLESLQQSTNARVMFIGDVHGNTRQLVRDFGHAVSEGVNAIISAGDFGVGFHIDDLNDDCPFIALAQDLVTATSIPIFFVDGNHENFDYIERWTAYDESGVGRIFTHANETGVFHLRRGAILTIANTNILAMGGAISVDRDWRTLGVDYWERESIVPEDLQAAALASTLHGIDILVTHDGPTTPISLAFDYHTNNKEHWDTGEPYFPQSAIDDSWANRDFIDQLTRKVRAPLHFHGHFHNPYVYHDADTESTVIGLDRDNAKKIVDHAVIVNIDPTDFVADISPHRTNAAKRLRAE